MALHCTALAPVLPRTAHLVCMSALQDPPGALSEAQITEPTAHPVCLSQDLPGALSEAQIAESMGLHDIKTRPWSIFKTSAIKGDGLFEVNDEEGERWRGRGRQVVQVGIGMQVSKQHSDSLTSLVG